MNKLKSSLLVSLLLVTPAVFAHAHLTTTIPAANSIVTTAPANLTLSFSEAIEPSFSHITIMDGNQTVIPTQTLTTVPGNSKELLVTPRQALSAGNYKVTWSVLSVDGHKTTGDYSFIIKS